MCMFFHDEKEIRLQLWQHDSEENEIVKSIVFTDKSDSRLYSYRNCEVLLYKCVKRGVIEIIAVDESYQGV